MAAAGAAGAAAKAVVIHEGPMVKRAIGKSKRPHINWKARWFRLTANELIYATTEYAKTPAGFISLDAVTVIEHVDIQAFSNQRPNLIQIGFVDGDVQRVLYTQCKTRAEADRWLQKIRGQFPRTIPAAQALHLKYHSGFEREAGVWTCCRRTRPEGCCHAYFTDGTPSASRSQSTSSLPSYDAVETGGADPADEGAAAAADKGNPYDNDEEFSRAKNSEIDDGHYEEPLDDHELEQKGRCGSIVIDVYRPGSGGGSKSEVVYENLPRGGVTADKKEAAEDPYDVIDRPPSVSQESPPVPKARLPSASRQPAAEPAAAVPVYTAEDSDPSDDEGGRASTYSAYENVDPVTGAGGGQMRPRFASYEAISRKEHRPPSYENVDIGGVRIAEADEGGADETGDAVYSNIDN
mmetsp:Transcript_37411/g.98094  ORF Transcript_37411/g.98094 Transcript_37411/m.98094 type:complete len:408 (-) Transcript_37411:7-1230(-)